MYWTYISIDSSEQIFYASFPKNVIKHIPSTFVEEGAQIEVVENAWDSDLDEEGAQIEVVENAQDSDLDEEDSSEEDIDVVCDECVVGHVHVDSGMTMTR